MNDLPQTHCMTETGIAWRPEVRTALEALRIPEAALELFIGSGMGMLSRAPSPDGGNGLDPVPPAKLNGKDKGAKAERRATRKGVRPQPPASMLAELKPGERLFQVKRVSGAVEWLRHGLTLDRYHIDADRTGVFKDPPPGKGGAEDEEPKSPPPKIEDETGLPALLRCVCPRGRPDREGAAPSEVKYLLEWRWPHGERSRAEWFSAGEIRKGEHLDRFQAPITGKGNIDFWAKIIFAQQRGFAVPIEFPVRHSGFSAADEAPAYTLPDGRTLLPWGEIETGTIAGEPPLLQRKRSDRWRERFQCLPASIPSEEDHLAGAIAALLKFDPKGRASCAAMLGIRALLYSLRSMDVTVFLSGLRGTGKTAIAQIMHWAQGPCAAGDEPDMSFRTTFLGSELTGDRAHDCAFLIDDGDRVRANDPGSPLKPENIKLISDLARAAFDGAAARVRGGRHYSLAQQRRIQQLLAFSAETPIGLEASVLARTIWWSFEKGEVELEPMLAADWQETQTWIDCQEVFTAIGHAIIRCVLDIWHAKGREAAVNFIRDIDTQASQLAAAAELGGEAEDRPRIQRGLAMIIAGGILCDIGAGTENLMRDLALEYGARLAGEQLGRLGSGAIATVGFDLEWFRAAFEDLINGGEHLWLDGKTGRLLGETKDSTEVSYLTGLGYQWRGEIAGFVPSARTRMGWLSNEDREYWADPGALFAYFERRVTRQGGTFPFSRQKLPSHLVGIRFAKPASDRPTSKPYIPRSDPKYPERGSQPWVLRIPFEVLNAETVDFKRGERGERGDGQASHWNNSEIGLPASCPDFSPLPRSGEKLHPEAGRPKAELNQYVTDDLPALPALPARNGASIGSRPIAIASSGKVSPIATLPPQTLKPGDPLAPSRRLAGAAARRAEAAHAQVQASMAREASPPTYSASLSPSSAPVVVGPSTRSNGSGAPPSASPGPAAQPNGDGSALPTPANGSAHDVVPTPAARSNGDGSALPTPAEPAADHRADATTAISEREPKYWPERLAVLDRDVFLIGERDGSITRLALPASARPGATIGALLRLMIEHVLTQLWITPAWWKASKLPARLKGSASERDGMEHKWIDPGSLPPSWGMRKAGRLKPWMRFYREGASGSIVLAAPQLEERARWKDARSAETLLKAIMLLKAQFGVSYKSGPGSFFQDIIIHSRQRGAFDAELAAKEFPPPYRGSPDIAPGMAWERQLETAELDHKYVYRFDNNKNYIYAMNRLRLPIGKPELVTRPDFDPRRGGCWFARVEGEPRFAALPHPCHRTGERASPEARDWYTTAQLASAAHQGLRITVTKAWLYPGARPMLEQTYAAICKAFNEFQRLADAGNEGAELAMEIVKDAYTRGLGWFDMEKDRGEEELIDLHRPDWYAEVRAAGWAHILRQLTEVAEKSGRTPFAASKDAVWFTSDNPDPIAFARELGLPIGRRFGVFKPDGEARLADVLPILKRPGNHLIELTRAMRPPGKPAQIKAALKAADDEAAAKAAARRK